MPCLRRPPPPQSATPHVQVDPRRLGLLIGGNIRTRRYDVPSRLTACAHCVTRDNSSEQGVAVVGDQWRLRIGNERYALSGEVRHGPQGLMSNSFEQTGLRRLKIHQET